MDNESGGTTLTSAVWLHQLPVLTYSTGDTNMQRDMDLIRQVLLSAEAGPPYPAIEGYTEGAIKYHRMLAIDHGLLKGTVQPVHTHPTEIPGAVIVRDVTWEGHDFIDAVREDTKWNKVKGYVADAGKQLTIETAKFAIAQLFHFPPQ